MSASFVRYQAIRFVIKIERKNFIEPHVACELLFSHSEEELVERRRLSLVFRLSASTISSRVVDIVYCSLYAANTFLSSNGSSIFTTLAFPQRRACCRAALPLRLVFFLKSDLATANAVCHVLVSITCFKMQNDFACIGSLLPAFCVLPQIVEGFHSASRNGTHYGCFSIAVTCVEVGVEDKYDL